MLINQISVFVENKPGRLAQITKVLRDSNIDIRALSLADTTHFGILRLIVNDPVKCEAALKQANFTVSTTQVIAVKVEDRPGGLYEILQALYDNGISVEYSYAFITRSSEAAFVILRVENTDDAQLVLNKHNISLLSPEEVYNI